MGVLSKFGGQKYCAGQTGAAQKRDLDHQIFNLVPLTLIDSTESRKIVARLIGREIRPKKQNVFS